MGLGVSSDRFRERLSFLKKLGRKNPSFSGGLYGKGKGGVGEGKREVDDNAEK